jgi:hypothetical protein
MPDGFNMIERKEPKFVQFADGEVIEGMFVAIEKVVVNGKPVARFTLMDLESRELVSFLGTAQINQKLRSSDLSHLVRIRCEGTSKDVIKNGNGMKLFKVAVSDIPVPKELCGAVIITNEDIPF